MHVPRAASQFDERRNSSRVFPVSEQDGINARRALAALHRDQPELCAWIKEGYPTLTEAEHLARFGEPYSRKPRAVT